MVRQKVLHDDSKRLEFVIGEAALRWGFGTAGVMAEQLERLAGATALPAVTLAVVPLTGGPDVWHSHSFSLYGDRAGEPALVHVETLTTALIVSQADDVEEYRAAFARLRDGAVRGDEAVAFVRAVAASLRE